ncbi:TPA: hypothetical protein ACPG2N_000599 [Haemophilus influenzae 10810]
MSILGSMTDAVNKTKTPQAPTISTQPPQKIHHKQWQGMFLIY